MKGSVRYYFKLKFVMVWYILGLVGLGHILELLIEEVFEILMEKMNGKKNKTANNLSFYWASYNLWCRKAHGV